MERDRQSLYMNMQSPNKYSSYVSAPRGMLGGPSMDTASLYQLLAQQIAGSSPAMGGIGAAGGMGTAESALSGPGGLAMALPMKYLSGMHNQAQEAINAFTGMPNPVRKDPMRQIGAFLDQFTNKPVLSPGAIGTQNNISSVGGGGLIGTVGAMQALGSGNPGLQAALMGSMFPGPGAEPFRNEEPDKDQRGGPSDNDADNVYRFSGDEMPIEITKKDIDATPLGLARGMVNNTVSQMEKVMPKGEMNTGALQRALASAAASHPQERAMGRMSSGSYVPNTTPRLSYTNKFSGIPASSFVDDNRPQPQLRIMGQDYRLGDYTLPKRRSSPEYGGSGGGFERR